MWNLKLTHCGIDVGEFLWFWIGGKEFGENIVLANLLLNTFEANLVHGWIEKGKLKFRTLISVFLTRILSDF